MKTKESLANENWWTGKTAWKEGLPYLTPGAVDALESRADPYGIALEFGAGGSTIWFAKHFRFVQSFETNPVWKQRVEERLKAENLKNVIVDPMNRLVYFENTPFTGHLSLVLVDSEGSRSNRPALSRKTLPWLAANGTFVLDNYARYKLDFLDEKEWDITLHNEPHWDGKGTLIATRK